MNDNLLLHPKTKMQLGYFLKSPPHALMIAGAPGGGKKSLAAHIASSLLEINQDRLNSYPYFLHVKRLKNKQDITIEQVRGVIAALKLRVPGAQKVQRVIFIEDAHLLSAPAQNALLKALEEPAVGIVFLLSVNSVRSVLPTIASRAQLLEVQPVTLDKALQYWQKEYTSAQIDSAWRLSGGSAGLLSALLSEDQDHPLKESVQQARKFLGSKTYERLLTLDNLSRNKEQFGLFLEALARILNFLHRNALKNNKNKQAKSILESRQMLQTTQKALQMNVSPKIIALKLASGLQV